MKITMGHLAHLKKKTILLSEIYIELGQEEKFYFTYLVKLIQLSTLNV